MMQDIKILCQTEHYKRATDVCKQQMQSSAEHLDENVNSICASIQRVSTISLNHHLLAGTILPFQFHFPFSTKWVI